MSSIERLSWHTATSNEIIDVEESDNNLSGLTPLNSNDHRNGLVSENFERTTFIGFPTENVRKITRKNKFKSGCYVNIRPKCQCVQLKIPWIITLISVIQIVVHYIGCDTTVNALIFTPTRRNDLWRFFSYGFLHSGPVHLYSNVALQIFMATPLEMDQGHCRVLAVYFGGVLFGALGSALTNPLQGVVGASAGVYSLLISHISHGILNWSTLSHRVLRFIAVVVMCCSDIIFIFSYGFYENKKSVPKISLAAHGCGAMAGFLFGFAVFHRSKECSGKFNYYRLISMILVICLIAISAYFLFK